MSKIKEKTKKLIDNTTVLSVILSIFSTAALVMSLLSASYSFITLIADEQAIITLRLYASLAFAMLFVVHALTVYKLRKNPKRIKYIFYCVMTFLLTIFMSIFGLNLFAHQFLMLKLSWPTSPHFSLVPALTET